MSFSGIVQSIEFEHYMHCLDLSCIPSPMFWFVISYAQYVMFELCSLIVLFTVGLSQGQVQTFKCTSFFIIIIIIFPVNHLTSILKSYS